MSPADLIATIAIAMMSQSILVPMSLSTRIFKISWMRAPNSLPKSRMRRSSRSAYFMVNILPRSLPDTSSSSIGQGQEAQDGSCRRDTGFFRDCQRRISKAQFCVRWRWITVSSSSYDRPQRPITARFTNQLSKPQGPGPHMLLQTCQTSASIMLRRIQ